MVQDHPRFFRGLQDFQGLIPKAQPPLIADLATPLGVERATLQDHVDHASLRGFYLAVTQHAAGRLPLVVASKYIARSLNQLHPVAHFLSGGGARTRFLVGHLSVESRLVH